MTVEESIKLVAVLAVHWDHREWSEEKIDLYSRMIGDLEYRTTSRAIEWLVKNHGPWAPTVSQIRQRVSVIEQRQRHRRELAQNRAERRALEGARLKSLPPVPAAVQELIRKIKSIPGVKVEENGERPELTPEQIDARKRVLRQQAQFLLGQERFGE